MPVNYIKHGDFTFDDEKVELVGRTLEVYNEKDAKLGQFTSPNAEINGDQLIKRRQILLDPTSVADLNEGDTPREDSIKIVTFSETLGSYGSYIGFTRHAKKRNRDSILEMARRQLAHNRLYDIEATRFRALNSTTYSIALVTSPSLSWWDTFQNAVIRLLKNGADGDIAFICPPEVAASIAKEAKASNTLIQGTADGAALFKKGYVGEYAGVHIVRIAEDYLNDSANSAYRCYFITKTKNGLWPIVENGLNPGNIETIVHDIGDGGHQDPTDEVGTIALRIDYVGAFLEHPECVLKLTGATFSAVRGLVDKDVPEAYELQADPTTNRGAGRDNAEYGKVVAGGEAFKVAVAAVAAADGTAIASPTVTIKIGSSSGTAVTAGSDGKYSVTPGVKYYFSVAKTNYTTKTGTFIADPSVETVTVALAAS